MCVARPRNWRRPRWRSKPADKQPNVKYESSYGGSARYCEQRKHGGKTADAPAKPCPGFDSQSQHWISPSLLQALRTERRHPCDDLPAVAAREGANNGFFGNRSEERR